MFDYQLVKKALNLQSAGAWLRTDSKDDFFPDALGFEDIDKLLTTYLKDREHRLLQIDTYPCLVDYVPKKTGMLREAVYLHPAHRLLYLATLHYLLPKLDRHVPPEVYSYRLDKEDPDAYPFPNRGERWKSFHNDFRQACLDTLTGAVLVTDIASFYDHIAVDDLVSRASLLLGAGASPADRAVIEFLGALLKQCTLSGFGLPQNLDPSSFFASMYLSAVDREIVDKRYRYFRWVDDIRICARNKKQALRALHDLQAALGRHRQFLASDKTRIIEKGTKEFDELLDVSDDVRLAEIEDNLARGTQVEVAQALASAEAGLRAHAGAGDDDRKFRAYANRTLEIGAYPEFKSQVGTLLADVALPRLASHPERSDYWTKFLAVTPPATWLPEVDRLLRADPSVYNWQRFYLWRLVLSADAVPAELLAQARSAVTNPVSDLEAYQAIIALGKHGNANEREALFTQFFSPQRSYPIQRALLIAIQELDAALRKRFYDRALTLNREHAQLVEYLTTLPEPNYGLKPQRNRALKPEPTKFTVAFKTGIGLVNGQVTKYRLSQTAYDYE
jgi:hypothetical protein